MSGRQVIERVWQASLDVVWELWATPAGLSSWWGPNGFTVEVLEMDLVVGGTFSYTMRASSPEMAAMMEKNGRPAEFTVNATYTDVSPKTTLGYKSPFGPEFLFTTVTFEEADDGVHMSLVIDSTKPEMTGGAAGGWRSAVDKFEARLAEVQA